MKPRFVLTGGFIYFSIRAKQGFYKAIGTGNCYFVIGTKAFKMKQAT